MKEDVRKFYLSVLTKKNDKVRILQKGDRIATEEFYVADQTMLCDTSLYFYMHNRFGYLDTTTEDDFNIVIERFRNGSANFSRPNRTR